MSTRLSFLISGLFHILTILCFYFYSFDSLQEINFRILLKKGTVPNVSINLPKNRSDENLHTSPAENAGAQGTEQKEIEKFKNEIHFPPDALEQRLESDCSWEVRIKSDGNGEILKTLQPCRYSIFETEFRRALKTWKFDLNEGTSLIIPVSFKIDDKEF
ncbi:hypothetical protein AB3N59_00200 [Leptospira sp. WS92.C1]